MSLSPVPWRLSQVRAASPDLDLDCTWTRPGLDLDLGLAGWPGFPARPALVVAESLAGGLGPLRWLRAAGLASATLGRSVLPPHRAPEGSGEGEAGD